jgi:hypothetical protein
MSAPRKVSTWFHAWETAMAQRGYPLARLSLDYNVDAGLSYSWTHNVDELAECWIEMHSPVADDNAWAVAHDCFLEVDSLRPVFIARSRALREIMDGMN